MRSWWARPQPFKRWHPSPTRVCRHGTTLPAPRGPAGISAEDGAPGTAPAAAEPQERGAPGCRPQIRHLHQGAKAGTRDRPGRRGPSDSVPTPQASAARRERALRRADEERARAAGQGAEVARLRRELEGLLRCRERLARRLWSLRGFGDYLQTGLEVPMCLEKASSGTLHGGIHSQDSYVPLSQPGGVCRGHGAVAGVRGPRALCRSVPQESHWAHVQSTATQKTLLLGQIKLAVLNLFQLATARLEVPTDVALEDTEAQLDMVSAALSPGQRLGQTRGHSFTSPDGRDTEVPVSAGAALHAGPGCHLC
uniref:Uncharacterized protein n=1 Tax=Accipiter nisus TaxID=211598 RepID=A0A8B9MMH9_9AVES